MLKNFCKLPFLSLALVAAVLFLAAPAIAGSILPMFQTGSNSLSDEDREYLIDRNWDGTQRYNPDGTDANVGSNQGSIDVLDSLRGAFNFNTLGTGAANLGGLTPNNELTGVYQVKLFSIVGPPGVVGSQYIFGPDPAFESIFGPGAIAAVYEDATHDFTSDWDNPAPAISPPKDPDGNPANGPFDDGTVGARILADPIFGLPTPNWTDVSTGSVVDEEAFIATALSGIHRLTLGFLGLGGEGVEGTLSLTGANNVLSLFSVSQSTGAVSINLGLNTLFKDPGWDFLQINRLTPQVYNTLAPGLVDFAGQQTIKGVLGRDTVFEVSTDTNLDFNATIIPEPASLLLFGGGLLGLAGFSRRRSKIKK